MGHKRHIPAKLGRKLKAIREHLGLTKEQMIERLDYPSISLSRRDICRFEDNLSDPRSIILLRYARLVGVMMTDLVDDEVDLELND